MPIHMTVSPLDRLIVGVATGDLTLEDLEKFVGDIIAGGILPYRVIVDIAASKLQFTASQLEAFAAAVFVLEKDKQFFREHSFRSIVARVVLVRKLKMPMKRHLSLTQLRLHRAQLRF